MIKLRSCVKPSVLPFLYQKYLGIWQSWFPFILKSSSHASPKAVFFNESLMVFHSINLSHFTISVFTVISSWSCEIAGSSPAARMLCSFESPEPPAPVPCRWSSRCPTSTVSATDTDGYCLARLSCQKYCFH